MRLCEVPERNVSTLREKGGGGGRERCYMGWYVRDERERERETVGAKRMVVQSSKSKTTYYDIKNHQSAFRLLFHLFKEKN